MAAVYSILYQDRSGRGKSVNTVQIAYTTEPYSSGLSVSGESLGCPNNIDSLMVYDSQGYHAAFSGGKIRLFVEGGGAGPLAEVSGNQTITLKVIATGW